MTIRIYLRIQTLLVLLYWRLVHGPVSHRRSDRGQATAEYALVVIGAAAVALLVLGWATSTGKVTALLDKVLGVVSNMVK